MEHGGFRPEEILSLSPDERTVWQAIAELNSEKRCQDIKNAVVDAIALVMEHLGK